MSAADIAQLLAAGMKPPEGNNDLGYAQGQVIAWDELSGTNTVRIWNQDYNNLSALQSGIGVLFQPGDKVGLLRFQTTYFVLGKVAAPGAGAASQIRSARVTTTVNTGAQAFGDLPGSPGPVLNNVYIGSSRRCLVVSSAEISTSQSSGYQGVQVSGASSIPVSTAISNAYLRFNNGAGLGLTVEGAVTSTTLLTAADGLNQGFNTFGCQYRITLNGGGTGVIFAARTLTVIPF